MLPGRTMYYTSTARASRRFAGRNVRRTQKEARRLAAQAAHRSSRKRQSANVPAGAIPDGGPPPHRNGRIRHRPRLARSRRRRAGPAGRSGRLAERRRRVGGRRACSTCASAAVRAALFGGLLLFRPGRCAPVHHGIRRRLLCERGPGRRWPVPAPRVRARGAPRACPRVVATDWPGRAGRGDLGGTVGHRRSCAGAPRRSDRHGQPVQSGRAGPGRSTGPESA